ncbi:MAG: hypothetical protein PVF91_07810 [Chromatiales bacterium]|jgi:hypothetical protein
MRRCAGIRAPAAAALALGILGGQGCTVRVVNDASEPLPVTGELAVDVGAVEVAQAGAWSVGIDPATNGVRLQEGPVEVLFDSGLLALGDAETRELGPVDLLGTTVVRVLTHGVNGKVRVDVLTDLAAGPIRLDRFNVGQENTAEFDTRLYQIPGPAMRFRVKEIGGPGGANIRVVLVGR